MNKIESINYYRKIAKYLLIIAVPLLFIVSGIKYFYFFDIENSIEFINTPTIEYFKSNEIAGLSLYFGLSIFKFLLQLPIAAGIVILAVQYMRLNRNALGTFILILGYTSFGVIPLILSFFKLSKEDTPMTIKNKKIISNSAMVLLIIGISTIYFIIGWLFIIIGILLVFMLKVNEQKYVYAIMILIFGSFTIGIWPLVTAINSKKKYSEMLYDTK